MNVTTGKRGTRSLVSVGGYGVLFLFGLMQGMIGSFHYARAAGSVPAAALAFCVGILATCLLAAWGMRSVSGAVLPGVGWVIAAFVLSKPVSNGSVIITNTAPGKWYLYGGTLSVAAAMVLSFAGMAVWGTGRAGRATGRTRQSGGTGRSGVQPRRAGDT